MNQYKIIFPSLSPFQFIYSLFLTLLVNYSYKIINLIAFLVQKLLNMTIIKINYLNKENYMDKKERVLKKLDELNIKYELIDHSPVYTIEEMENLNLEEKGHIVKNLFLKNSNGKKHYLVVLKSDKKADLKSIRSQIESSALSFASEERLEKHLGLLKGAVTPLGIINDDNHCVNVLIDEDLKNQSIIGVHPNVNTSTVFISYDDMIKFINIFGNEILYVNI